MQYRRNIDHSTKWSTLNTHWWPCNSESLNRRRFSDHESISPHHYMFTIIRVYGYTFFFTSTDIIDVHKKTHKGLACTIISCTRRHSLKG